MHPKTIDFFRRGACLRDGTDTEADCTLADPSSGGLIQNYRRQTFSITVEAANGPSAACLG